VSGQSAIVVGAGFAGVTAARDLSRLGYRVTVVEARDRIGGRTERRRFAGTDVEIETGGAWFAGPTQSFAHREIVGHGLRYKPDPPATSFAHLVGGQRLEMPFPLQPEDHLAFERASFHVLNAAQHVDRALPVDLQPLAAYDITWEEFIGQVDITPTVRDLFDTQALDVNGGLATENGSTIAHLWQTALYGHSILNWGTLFDQQLEGGTKALIEAIADDAPEVRFAFGTPVRSVAQHRTGVEVTAVDGQTFEADAAVIALPVNVWDSVTFDPPLSEDKRQGAALRPGTRGVKVWALVKDAPSGFFGYANVEASHGLTLINSQAEVDGAQLIFAVSPVGRRDGVEGGFDPLDKAQVQRAYETFLPGATVLEVDAQDWNVDPFAMGSWSTYRIGQMEYLGGMRQPEGRLTFAGADICRGWMTWIDGAIESGTSSAAELHRLLAAR
jgi:monoamine oxidase